MRGTANTLNITHAGVGKISAFDLTSDVCDINHAGVGGIEVTVNDELDVTIAGVGTVFYKGNPTIT